MASAHTKAKSKAEKLLLSKVKVEEGVAQRTQFDRYEYREIHRRELKNAEYNPRRISDEAKRKLRNNLKIRGLMGAPVWNPTTGNLVGGHQRVNQLDALEGTDNYMIRVLVVPMDEKTEKEQNIFLNNPLSQGEWDYEKLEEMFKTPDIEIDSTGFDMGEIYKLFGDSPVIQQPERLKELSEKLSASRAAIAEIKTRGNETDDIDFYLVAVFKSYEDRKAFTDAAGFADNRYVDGKRLHEKIANASSE